MAPNIDIIVTMHFNVTGSHLDQKREHFVLETFKTVFLTLQGTKTMFETFFPLYNLYSHYLKRFIAYRG